MKIAVITGASSGMGKEFTLQLAKEGALDALWVIARREERLRALAREVSLPVRLLLLDLTKPESFRAYQALLEQEQPDVAVLVNASGFGKFGRYDEIPLQDQLDMIDLNGKALVAMTQLTLPYMHPGGRIIQVGSLSAFQPVPYLNVYAASKALVLRYTRGLRAELKGRDLRVTAFCPGWVRTEFFDHAEQTSTRAVTYFNQLFTAKEVVAAAIRDNRKNKAVSVPGWRIRLQVLAVKLLPTAWVLRVWLRQQKHL